MSLESILAFAGFLIICLGVGGVAGYATLPEIAGWHSTLNKPNFNPPNWIFGPIWTLLYILMAISAWLMWQRGGLMQPALGFFAVQLIFNFAWSFIFFRAHLIGWALVDICLLWLAIVATIFSFVQVSAIAAWLLIPYLAWVSFATLLNASIWRLN